MGLALTDPAQEIPRMYFKVERRKMISDEKSEMMREGMRSKDGRKYVAKSQRPRS